MSRAMIHPALWDAQDAPAAAYCARCGGELYGDLDMVHAWGKDYCPVCFERLEEEL